MQCKQKLMLLGIALALLGAGVEGVRAELITLDFDSPGTGSGILDTPLVLAEGTITARNAGFTTAMMMGNSLEYREPINGFTSLEFDFDVALIRFIYTGNVTGVFTANVLDAKGVILDSFFNPDTAGQEIWGPITLSGVGIRKLEFADAPDGAMLAAIDNVEVWLTPEPAGIYLWCLGLVWIGRQVRMIPRSID